MRPAHLFVCAVIGRVDAWEFPKPPIAPVLAQHPMSLGDSDDDIDIVTGSQFHGLKTFANLPYVNCFSDAEADKSKYDIAILGAPFDTVGLVSHSGPFDIVNYIQSHVVFCLQVCDRKARRSLRSYRHPDRQPADEQAWRLRLVHWSVGRLPSLSVPLG
jgi:hypothetical protein